MKDCYKTHCSRNHRSWRGFTLVEMLVTLSVILIMVAAAAPMAKSASTTFKLKSAASSVSGVVQQVRFQSISNGYQYKVTFDKTNHTYQISSDQAGSGTFTNVGGAVPFTGSAVTLGAATTMQFSPSGKVTFTAGSSPLVLTLNSKTASVSVTTYGNISVAYGS